MTEVKENGIRFTTFTDPEGNKFDLADEKEAPRPRQVWRFASSLGEQQRMRSPETLLLSIGHFARMTHLSVKTLRHYHDIGLLEPAEVDPATGYRRYTEQQVPIAQVIRRFRDLGMPLEELSAVVHTEDAAARNAVITRHLAQMEDQLRQTRETVASLRNLLDNPAAPVPVEFRSTAPTAVLAGRAVLGSDQVPGWLSPALAELPPRSPPPLGQPDVPAS
ncbi:helix-turn-helix domain-containing protein [Streptomyces parvulus]|uniref:MerR family transcriptional regulator n=1 Tax=Streptomyces parvulus TaxID=146923 RepID=UPI0033332E4A